MNKLIVITTSILLGVLANAAMAAKPASEIKLSAGPMENITTCRVAKHTDQAIEVFMEYCFGLRNNTAPAECFDVSPTGVSDPAPVLGTLAPGHFDISGTKADSTYSVTCELTYAGGPGDITGMLCGIINAGGTTACVPLQAQ